MVSSGACLAVFHGADGAISGPFARLLLLEDSATRSAALLIALAFSGLASHLLAGILGRILDNLRSAFNQVRVLDDAGYGSKGEYVGLDVKVMRTQKRDKSFQHLASSLDTFKFLLDKVRSYDRGLEAEYVKARDYEGLDAYVLRHLMGV